MRYSLGPTLAKSGKVTRRSACAAGVQHTPHIGWLCGRHRIASSRATSGAPTRSRPSGLTSANRPFRDCSASSGTCRTWDLSSSCAWAARRTASSVKGVKVPP